MGHQRPPHAAAVAHGRPAAAVRGDAVRFRPCVLGAGPGRDRDGDPGNGRDLGEHRLAAGPSGAPGRLIPRLMWRVTFDTRPSRTRRVPSGGLTWRPRT